MPVHIDPDLAMGPVRLSVANLARSLTYYQQTIGLTLLTQGQGVATLGVGEVPLLQLHELPGARLVRRATGLYHFALRLPSRPALAQVIQHFATIGYSLDGAADHIVSEALYMSDPDGHGIEIYHDRPRHHWYDAQGRMLLTTDPLDLGAIMRTLPDDRGPAWAGLPPGTDMGHVHLQVADLRAAEQFYLGVMGFERMAELPGASFIGAGGYHHQLGMNTWAGAGVAAPPEHAARLLRYTLQFSSQALLQELLDRLHAAGIAPLEEQDGWLVRDPAHIWVQLQLR